MSSGVSVVIPAHDAERTIEATVRSVLAQTLSPTEVIVVDDGSRDRTAALVASLNDPRCRVVHQAQQGPASARNRGIEASTAPYIAFLDADDLWMPEKLRFQVQRLDEDATAMAVQCGATYIDDTFRVLSVRRCREDQNDFLAALLFQNLPAFPSTVMIRRAAFESVGLFDPSLPILEDWDLALRLAQADGLRSIVEPLTYYRIHSGNRSRHLPPHIAGGFRVLEKIFDDGTRNHLRRRSYAAFFRMISGGYFTRGDHLRFAAWAVRAIATDPRELAYFLSFPSRRFSRMWSRRGWAHVSP